MIPVPPQLPKKCPCCSAVHDEKSWSRLPYRGVQVDEFEAQELRNCGCGSTISILTAIFQKYSEAA